jgi:hypothetical protein
VTPRTPIGELPGKQPGPESWPEKVPDTFSTAEKVPDTFSTLSYDLNRSPSPWT